MLVSGKVTLFCVILSLVQGTGTSRFFGSMFILSETFHGILPREFFQKKTVETNGQCTTGSFFGCESFLSTQKHPNLALHFIVKKSLEFRPMALDIGYL